MTTMPVFSPVGIIPISISIVVSRYHNWAVLAQLQSTVKTNGHHLSTVQYTGATSNHPPHSLQQAAD